MASIKVEQLKKINSKCENGFTLDVFSTVVNDDKRLTKEIVIAGKDYKYEAVLRFDTIYERFEKVGIQPVLVINKLSDIREGEKFTFSRVAELYKSAIGDITKRKSIKVLQDATKDFNDNAILDILRAKELCA